MTNTLRNLALALLLAGCGNAGETENVTVTWALKKADGAADVCPANHDKVKIVSQGIRSSTNTSTGEPFVQVFDCVTLGAATTWKSGPFTSGFLLRLSSVTRNSIHAVAGHTQVFWGEDFTLEIEPR